MRLGLPSSLFHRSSVCALVLMAVLARGYADEAHPAPSPAASSPAATPASPSKPADNSLDFDLLGDQKPAPPGANLSLPASSHPKPDSLMLEKQVRKRRLMLQLHQGFGFATLALVAATCVLGQLSYIDMFGGGTYTKEFLPYHETLAWASTATFATTGLLGVLAPTPYKKPLRLDAALLHKVMMGLATAGFVAQIALGFATASKGGELVQRDLALAHLVTGYGIFAAMATGYLAFVF